jgi:hypothetical protein
LEREVEITPEELGPPIIKSEYEKALNELRLKKGYEVENIPAELLQAFDEEMKHALYRLINDIYTTKKFLTISRKL